MIFNINSTRGHTGSLLVINYRPPPCSTTSNGPAFIFMCQTLRFSSISSGILYSFVSSLMLPSHVFLGLPFLLFMWPYHLSHFGPREVVIVSMLTSLQLSSFSTWTLFVLPLPHLCILSSLSQVCGFWIYFFLIAQHSDLYVIAGFTMVL